MKTNDVFLYFGSKTKTGEALGITKAAISQWGEKVPPLRAYEIERLTNGELKVDQDYKQAS